MRIKAWLNHEFSGFWFQGKIFLSFLWNLASRFSFHVNIRLISFSIVTLSHVIHICLVTVKMFHWKWGILSQTVFALFCRFSMAPSNGFRILPFNHVHVLSETVNEVKQVTWPIKCTNNWNAYNEFRIKGRNHVDIGKFWIFNLQMYPIWRNTFCDVTRNRKSRDCI